MQGIWKHILYADSERRARGPVSWHFQGLCACVCKCVRVCMFPYSSFTPFSSTFVYVKQNPLVYFLVQAFLLLLLTGYDNLHTITFDLLRGAIPWP